METSLKTKMGIFAVVIAFVVAIVTAVPALADEGNDPFWNQPTAIEQTDGCVTSYGVRAGSAGPDFLGISGTNFDFSGGSASSDEQYMNYVADVQDKTRASAGLAIWATSVNESVNPYYANLYYNTVTGQSALQATTWMKNEDNSSWGDSFGATSTDFIKSTPTTDVSTINGLEYEPNIIFGDAKYVGWNNYEEGISYIREYLAETNQYTPDAYVNNDATNIWTQIYSMGKLAEAADGIGKVADDTEVDAVGDTAENVKTRYNDGVAATSANNYEKAIKGNMLYIASQIDSGEQAKKTVAYLYAIDENGTGYFFTPQASEMLIGDDTGTQGPVDPDNLYGEHVETTVDTATSGYAANNGTINLGYMGVLPFITDTFDNDIPVVNEETGKEGIVMKVEDIYKANPACKVATSVDENGEVIFDSVLKDVDVIIYNTTTATNLDGTSGGKNSSGITSGGALDDDAVSEWATQHGFTGNIVAGDDFGTSTNQGYGDIDTTENGMAPLLYCQRNYTADKNARAAWAFSQVYPELYDGNANASYCYWVDNIYHVNTDNVPTVVQYMTNQIGDVTYNTRTASILEGYFEKGYEWWDGISKDVDFTNLTEDADHYEWLQYAYYNGSSRASYYSGNPASEEPTNVIGIFALN